MQGLRSYSLLLVERALLLILHSSRLGLIISFDTENQVTIESFFSFDGEQWRLGSGEIEEFNFKNSESKTAEQIFSIGFNIAPEVGASIEDQSGTENEDFSFMIYKNCHLNN